MTTLTLAFDLLHDAAEDDLGTNEQLPTGWIRTTVGEGIEIICGQHVLAKNYSRTKGAIPYLTGPSDFDGGRIRASRFVDGSGVLCKRGDILLTVKGSGVGTLAVADQCYCISRQLIALRPLIWESRFVLRTFEHVTEKLNRLSAGTIPGITKPQVENWPLIMPPLTEQHRIVEILDEADAAVRMTEALIAAKLKHKRAWAEQLLTGKARFPEFGGEAWHETKLGTVLRESRTPAKTSHPGARLTVRLHTEGVEARKDRGTEVEEATVYYERRAGQLIYGKQNLHRGAVGIIPERLDGYSSSQDVPAFDWQPSGDPDFFLHYFSWKPFYERLERLATGTGSKRIHPAAFLSVSLHIPALAEQQKIAEVLSLMDEEIALRRRQLTALKAQRQGLMQKLLTGEVRVKEFAP
jgi:type I restriction enzyme S subunit